MDNRGVEISGNWKGAFSRVRISKLLVYLLIAPLFTFIQGVAGPIEKASATPTTGTNVDWSSDTYFDSYSSQTSSSTDLPLTNSLVWQVYYAHQPIVLSADAVNRLGFGTYLSGNNTVTWKYAISTLDTLWAAGELKLSLQQITLVILRMVSIKIL